MNAQRYKTRLTLRGLYFILFGGILLLASFYTGENLFYLSSYALVGMICVAFWTTRRSIKNIKLTCVTPEAVHRNEAFAYQTNLEDKRKRGSTNSVKLESESFEQPYAIDTTQANTPVQTRMYATMHQRGIHKLPSIKMSSTYPFGLFKQYTTVENEHSILVYPRVYPLTKSIMRELDDNGHTPKSSNNNDGNEFYSLREYFPGDDIRHISWKISARIGRLIIRELEPSITRMVFIVLDTRGIPGTDDEKEQFEQVIDLAASLTVDLLDQHFSVGLVTPDSSIGLSSGRHQSTLIMEELTILNPTREEDYDNNWSIPKAQNSDAVKIHLATLSTRWGMEIPNSRTRTLNPEEVLQHG